MQSVGSLPVDLILFAMIAAFLALRLRSILGKRTGFEGSPAGPLRRPGAPRTGPVIDAHAEPAPEAAARPLPDPASPAGKGLAAIVAEDRAFSPAQFLAGAEQAFRLIVSAFTAGDREKLRPLLTGETFAAFERVLTAREAAGETQRTEIREIMEASIAEAGLTGGAAAITVHFLSRQVNITLDRNHQPVAGTDAVTEIGDLWTFERRLGQADPTWRLSAARSA